MLELQVPAAFAVSFVGCLVRIKGKGLGFVLRVVKELMLKVACWWQQMVAVFVFGIIVFYKYI